MQVSNIQAVKPPPGHLAANDAEAQVLFPYGIGIDCHSKFIQVCVLYQSGRKVLRTEGTFYTEWQALLAAKEWALSVLGKLAKAESLRYCIESTGTYHLPILNAWHGVPCVVNPLLAGPTRRKTDVLDARLLAHHSITGVWKPSFVPEEQAQVLRVLWAARREALRAATRASNRINNIVLRFGHTFGRQAPMRQSRSEGILTDLIEGRSPKVPDVAPAGLPESVRPIIRALMQDMESAIDDERRAQATALNYVNARDWPTATNAIPGTRLLSFLRSVPGVGQTTALTWLAEVADPKRFQDAKQVAAYCGCDPSLKVSAGKVTSHVRRAGNLRLHQALLYAASGLLRKPQDALGAWGKSIAGRHKKGGYRKACGAIARRLAAALWHVHCKQEPFTYDGYRFSQTPIVEDMPLGKFLRAAAIKVLATEHIITSQQLADAFHKGRLAAMFGLGQTSIEDIKQWIASHTIRPCHLPQAQCAPAFPQDAAAKSYQLDSSRRYTPRASAATGTSGKQPKRPAKKRRNR